MYVEFISAGSCSDPSAPGSMCTRMGTALRLCDSGDVMVPVDAYWMAVGVSTTAEEADTSGPDVGVACPGPLDNVAPHVDRTGVEICLQGTITASGPAVHAFAAYPSRPRMAPISHIRTRTAR